MRVGVRLRLRPRARAIARRVCTPCAHRPCAPREYGRVIGEDNGEGRCEGEVRGQRDNRVRVRGEG